MLRSVVRAASRAAAASKVAGARRLQAAAASAQAAAAMHRGVHAHAPAAAPSPLESSKSAAAAAAGAGTGAGATSPTTWWRAHKSVPAGVAASNAAHRKMMRGGQSFHYAAFDPNPESTGAKIGEVILVKKHGIDLLHDPLFNKGSAFPLSERERMGLRGLVPPRVYNKKTVLQNQVQRVMNGFHAFRNVLNQYTYMVALQDRNETLFYACLMQHLELLAPIIYTPTVGLACQSYASIWRRARGMYFSALDVGNMHSMAFNWPIDDVQVIVVTDGSRILGLGDLGANGMGIPIGKLSLYTACAGIHPSRCLPVLIDVGTNNEHYLNDPMYLGLQQKRVTGDSYYQIVDEFIRAVTERWPKALVQFEDFSNDHAYPLLAKYHKKILCFNDDIQGTGAVAVASLLGAVKAVGQREKTALCDQRILMVGGGSAGLGIANSILYCMTQLGMEESEARKRFWVLDDHGLLGAGRTNFSGPQAPWVRNELKDGLSLLDTVKAVKPTVMIGVTGVGGLFTEAAVREMAKHTARPIIFPLSNPTDHAECTAQQAFEWTNGQCIFASGSPFQPVTLNGKTYFPNQSNNMFVFPAIGLGATSIHATSISQKMLNTVSYALAQTVKDEDLKEGKILPRLRDIRSVSLDIAVAMAKTAYEEGLVPTPPPPGGEEGLRTMISNNMWDPKYGALVRIDSGW